MNYYQSETRELVSLNSCELVHSQFAVLADYAASVALDYLAEIAEHLLPPAEASEKFFRLLLAVLDHLRAGAPGAVWRAVTYYSFWAVKLGGFLPDLARCSNCGEPLAGAAWFSRWHHGLLCATCHSLVGGGSYVLAADSRALSGCMFRLPVDAVLPGAWAKETAADLRRFLVQQIEAHIERKLATAPVLEAV